MKEIINIAKAVSDGLNKAMNKCRNCKYTLTVHGANKPSDMGKVVMEIMGVSNGPNCGHSAKPFPNECPYYVKVETKEWA